VHFEWCLASKACEKLCGRSRKLSFPSCRPCLLQSLSLPSTLFSVSDFTVSIPPHFADTNIDVGYGCMCWCKGVAALCEWTNTSLSRSKSGQRSPDYFGDFGRAVWTLVTAATMENWVQYALELMGGDPRSTLTILFHP
jgi:hypothetical protein